MRPQSKLPAPSTHTHVGWLGVRAYQSFESYWHGDGPRPSKTHACNPTSPGRYKGLCGQSIVPDDGRDMLEGGDVTRVVPVTTNNVRVTCRTCRRKMG